MSSLPLDSPYTAHGTVLYQVIAHDAYRAQMLGHTSIASPSDEALSKPQTTAAMSFKSASTTGARGSTSIAAALHHPTGADGHHLVSSAASATAALRAQKDQQQRSAQTVSFLGITRSGAVLGDGRRAAPASSILLPGASKAAVAGTRKPGRLAPLTGEEAVESGSSERMGPGAAKERTKAGPSMMTQFLTVEKALAQLFPPVAIPSQRRPTPSGDDTDVVDDTRVVRGQTSAGAPQEGEGSHVSTPLPPEWMQVAATDHTARIDVVLLHQHLAERCRKEHARPTGCLCTTREAIFNDGYRELMRQVTVLCPERGLLLEELDHHMALSNEAYDTLFDSACQYAARKSIERDLRSYLFDDKKKLESEERRLENRVNELHAKHDGLLKRFEEQKASTQKVQEEEIAYLKKATQQLVSEIKRLSTMESAMNAATKPSAEGA